MIAEESRDPLHAYQREKEKISVGEIENLNAYALRTDSLRRYMHTIGHRNLLFPRRKSRSKSRVRNHSYLIYM